MATRTNELPDHLFERGALWVVGVVVLWAFWAIFFVFEYVGDAIRLSAFLVALVVGMLIGVGFGYWYRRTETGLRVGRWYRNLSTGKKIAFAVVAAIPMAVAIYLTATAGISSLLLEAGLFGTFLTIHLFDIGLVHAHARSFESV